MQKRTIEQIIKFDSGLPIGLSAVTVVRRDGSEYVACVEISPRGIVHIVAKPTDSDMYTSWHRVKGDAVTAGKVVVWGARDAGHMSIFENPTARVDLRIAQ